MVSQPESISNLQPHNKTENNVVTKTKNIFLISGIVGVMTIGAVSMYGLSVIKSSNCGGSLNFRSSQSSQEFQFRKEPCNQVLPDLTLPNPKGSPLLKKTHKVVNTETHRFGSNKTGIPIKPNSPAVIKVEPSSSSTSVPVIQALKQRKMPSDLDKQRRKM